MDREGCFAGFADVLGWHRGVSAPDRLQADWNEQSNGPKCPERHDHRESVLVDCVGSLRRAGHLPCGFVAGSHPTTSLGVPRSLHAGQYAALDGNQLLTRKPEKWIPSSTARRSLRVRPHNALRYQGFKECWFDR